MPLLLTDAEIDIDAEAVDLALSSSEEEIAIAIGNREEVTNAGDLTDGGVIGGVKLYPMENLKRVERGRAAARRAWMWNGTETVLTLSWNTDGTRHDGGRSYLSKKHCLCCGDSGFRQHCRKCRINACPKCQSATDAKQIIPCFYLRKDDVPYQEKFYGEIDCFLVSCSRRDSTGFQTEEDMIMHAASRHGKQYEAYESAQRSREVSQLSQLQDQVNALLAAQLRGPVETPTTQNISELQEKAIAPARTTLKDDPPLMKLVEEASVYVSDKPPKPRKARRKKDK